MVYPAGKDWFCPIEVFDMWMRSRVGAPVIPMTETEFLYNLKLFMQYRSVNIDGTRYRSDIYQNYLGFDFNNNALLWVRTAIDTMIEETMGSKEGEEVYKVS